MKTIIETNEVKEHMIEPYRFKVLGGAKLVETSEEDVVDNSNIEQEVVPIEQEVIKQENDNKFVEELLKKSDELSSNLIKLQMQIEKQESEFERRLQSELERERQSSYENGYNKAKEELEVSIKEIKDKYLNSFKKLEEESKKQENFLKKLEEELSSVAIEVAKEVIAKEVKESSASIAKELSKVLMEELKDAKKIKLKVNPKDFEDIKSVYSDIEHISVDSDSAISEGGVVVLSDVGNLDGNIKTRLEKVKNLIDNG